MIYQLGGILFSTSFCYPDPAAAAIYTLSLHDALPILPLWQYYVSGSRSRLKFCHFGLTNSIKATFFWRRQDLIFFSLSIARECLHVVRNKPDGRAHICS